MWSPYSENLQGRKSHPRLGGGGQNPSVDLDKGVRLRLPSPVERKRQEGTRKRHRWNDTDQRPPWMQEGGLRHAWDWGFVIQGLGDLISPSVGHTTTSPKEKRITEREERGNRGRSSGRPIVLSQEHGAE